MKKISLFSSIKFKWFIKTGDAGFDVLLSGGSGMLAGSVIVLYGPPGIGKTIFVSEVAAFVAKSKPTIVSTNEDSGVSFARKLRKRFGSERKLKVEFSYHRDVDNIVLDAKKRRAKLIVIDSIHGMHSNSSQKQIGYAVAKLSAFAKKCGACVLITAHDTRRGHLAGPKMLRHEVDAIFRIEHVRPKRSGGFVRIRSVASGSTVRITCDGKNRSWVPMSAIYEIENGWFKFKEYE